MTAASSGIHHVIGSAARCTTKVIERVNARVFCHLEEGGGNPVTIFSTKSNNINKDDNEDGGTFLSLATQKRLAQTCDWESVIIEQPSRGTGGSSSGTGEGSVILSPSSPPPKLSFYMPSGEQVSFCAHAAMGAALQICLQSENEDLDEVSFTTSNLLHDEQQQQQQQNTNTNSKSNSNQREENEYKTIIYDNDIVALYMKTIYEQRNITQPSMLFRMLRDYCRIDASNDLALTPTKDNPYTPIICHGSIARPKTFVPLRSVYDLHEKAIAPSTNSSKSFELSCKALDETTGLYLYAKSEDEDGAWVCRQFPKSSGYAEDPATGIAAAALACHLHCEYNIELPAYKIYQGIAMGKPSLIVIDELEIFTNGQQKQQKQNNNVDVEASFRLLGRVEIDDCETLEIVEDDDNERK